MKLFLITILLWASPIFGQFVPTIPATKVGAAPTGWIQTKVNSDATGGITTLTVTPNAGITTGNCPVIAITTNIASTISSVKDNNGFSYTLMASGANGGVATVKMYSIPGTCSAASGITSFTATFTSGINIVMAVSEYAPASGSFTTAQLINTTANSQTSASISIPTQSANNFVVSAFQLGGGSSVTAGSSGNLRNTTAFSGDQAAFMDNTSSSPATTTTNITWTTAANYGAVAIELSTSTFNVVQFNADFGTSPSVTFLQPVQTGDYIIAMVFDGGAANVNETFTDSASNSYSQVTVSSHTYCSLTTDGDTMAMSYAKAAGAASAVGVTVNSASSAKRVFVVDVNGLTSTSPLDQVTNCAYAASQTGGSALTTSSVTIGQAKEMMVGIFGDAALATYTAGTGFTLMNGCGTSGVACKTTFTSLFTADEYKLLTSIAGYTASATASVTAEMAGFAATFKAQ